MSKSDGGTATPCYKSPNICVLGKTSVTTFSNLNINFIGIQRRLTFRIQQNIIKADFDDPPPSDFGIVCMLPW